MHSFTDLLKSLYTKDKLENIEIDTSLNIALTKWCSFDKDNLSILKNLVHYLFYLEPINYYYLLYANLPKRNKIPYLIKIDKKEVKENILLQKIKKVLNWSDRELQIHNDILEKVILNNQDYWKRELRIE